MGAADITEVKPLQCCSSTTTNTSKALTHTADGCIPQLLYHVYRLQSLNINTHSSLYRFIHFYTGKAQTLWANKSVTLLANIKLHFDTIQNLYCIVHGAIHQWAFLAALQACRFSYYEICNRQNWGIF